MLHPEKRPLVQQQVTQHAAAKRRNKRHHADTGRIQPFSRRFQQARQGERSRTRRFDQQAQPAYLAKRVRIHSQHPVFDTRMQQLRLGPRAGRAHRHEQRQKMLLARMILYG